MVLLDEVLLGQQRLGLGRGDALDRVDGSTISTTPRVTGLEKWEATRLRIDFAFPRRARFRWRRGTGRRRARPAARGAARSAGSFGAFRGGGDGHPRSEDRVGRWAALGQPLQRHTDAPDRRPCAAPWPKPRSATSSAGSHPTVNALQERVAELLGDQAAPVPADRHAVQRHRDAAARAPGRRRGAAAPQRAPVQRRGGRPGGDLRRDRCTGSTVREGSVAPATFEAGDQRSPPGDRYGPRTRVLWVEQTTNIAGGRVWPLETIRARARHSPARHGLRAAPGRRVAHDAVVASGVSGADGSRPASTPPGWTSARAWALPSGRAWPGRRR